jgi:hypothetical protein
MTELHKGYDLTNAIIGALEAAGLVVGDAIQPEAGGWQGVPGESEFVPYVDVWPTPGGIADGTIASPYSDVDTDYVLRTFGATRAQVEYVADMAWEVMRTADFSTSGRKVTLVRPDVLPGVIRDDDAQPPVFFAPGRWRICTTPA